MCINIINQLHSSQGAFEHFHQTLKAVNGLPWRLAAREVVQESTGFTPKELVFWANGQNLTGYVKEFGLKMLQGRQTDKAEAGDFTGKSGKKLPDRAEVHQLSPGDPVLVLLSRVTSPFQAKHCGPSLWYSTSQI